MSHPWDSLAVAVLVTATCVRALVLWWMPTGLSVDTDGYRDIAQVLRATGVFGYSAGHGDEPDRPGGWPVHPTAFRPPLYPLLLSVLVMDGQLSPTAIGRLHWLLGVGTTVLVYRLGWAWGLGRWSALAAALTAVDPILLNQSAQLMTETLAAFLAIASLAGLSWVDGSTERQRRTELPPRTASARRDLAAGFVMGLACLCRPTFLPWCGLIVADRWLTGRRQGRVATAEPKLVALVGRVAVAERSDATAGASQAQTQSRRRHECFTALGKAAVQWLQRLALVAGLLLTLLPWGLRNYWQFGQFKCSTSHGGFTLLLANNPDFYRYLREASWGEVWRSDELSRAWLARGSLRDPEREFLRPGAQSLPENSVLPNSATTVTQPLEFADDQLAYRLAGRFIRAEPLSFAWSCVVRLGRLWQVKPHQVDPDESGGRRQMRSVVAVWYGTLYVLIAAGVWMSWPAQFKQPWRSGWWLCLTFSIVHLLFWSDMRMRAPLMPFLCLAAARGAAALWRRRRAGER